MSDSDQAASAPGDKFKLGISVWLSACLFACIWFLSRFMTGRRQLRGNLHVIEDGLRRMQEEIEKRQRENSISYGENLEELMEELKKIPRPTTEEQKHKEAKTAEEEQAEVGNKSEAEEAEPLMQDKKND